MAKEAPSMTKEEAYEYLATLVTKEKAEKHKDQFEEEWPTIEGLPREQQERVLTLIAREIELKEELERKKVAPPKPKIQPTKWEDYVPETKREFFKRWMKRLEGR